MPEEPRPRRPRPPRNPQGGAGEPTVLMIVDRETREAYREGDGDDPAESGPLFFTSREKLDAYAREEAIEDYDAYPVPAGILGRLKGRPHWVDGERQ